MFSVDAPLDGPQVYTSHELARAAGVPVARVRALIDEGRVATIDEDLIPHTEAVRVGRALRGGGPFALPPVDRRAPVSGAVALAATRLPRSRAAGLPVAVSSAAHALVVVLVILLSMPRLGSDEVIVDLDKAPPRLVYLSLPGPGGGGGGGGVQAPTPAPRAMREGDSVMSSPMPEPEPSPILKPPEPEPPRLDAVRAPIVTAPAEARNRAGVLAPSTSEDETRGEGDEGGVGSGQGSGLGEGEGSGVGDGLGGGAGGGVHRPGSGVEPPVLRREVKPAYTDDARRASVQGEVVLEVIVLDDGRVGSARVLRGLGYGLDHQAVQAVRQWEFEPAVLKGTPVAVMVEVAVEFQLR